MRLLLSLILLTGIAGATPLEAQTVSGRLAVNCDSVIHRPVRDTVPLYLSGFGEPLVNMPGAHVVAMMVEEVMQRLELREIVSPRWPHIGFLLGDLAASERGTLAVVRLTLWRDGSVTSLAQRPARPPSELAATLMRAVMAAAAERALPLIPPAVGSDSLVIVLALRVDSAASIAHGVVGQAAVPRWSSSSEVQVERRRNPRHPLIRGQVVVTGLVRPSGAWDPATTTVIRSDDPQLERAVLGALRHWRFRPAMVDGCPVAQWVQVPFTFEMVD